MLWAVFLGTVGACDRQSVEEPIVAPPIKAGCGDRGGLQTSLYGAIETDVSWPGAQMDCDSMQRPDGQGIRLRFSGDILGERLTFIIALPELKAGEQTAESPANVTITIEGSGRFFSTPDLNSCWAEIESQTALPGDGGHYRIRGTLFCIAPLGQINGNAAVSVSDLSFTTLVKWRKK